MASTCPAAEEMPSVGTFAFGGVGFAGITSTGEYRFGEALASKDPKSFFHDWYSNGNNAEKAYCMVGFYYDDREHYTELKKQYQNQKIIIPTMSGCIGSSITLNELTQQIEAGRFKFYTENPARNEGDPFAKPTKPEEIQTQ